MKYISIKGLDNEIYVFDETDNLCNICSYPLNKRGGCLSCNIFHKHSTYSGGVFFFEKLLSVGRYFQMNKSEKPSIKSKDIMTWLILRYKGDEEFLPYCSELLRMKIGEFLSTFEIPNEKILICAVPDYEDREYKKGNLLVESVAKRLRLRSSLLLKKLTKNKKQHKSGSIPEKFNNVKGAFILNSEFVEKIKGKTVFLIDDVASSMASVNECAKILKRAGAVEIYVFTLGRNILPELEDKK